VLRNHRLLTDQSVDEPQADTADLRDDLPVFLRLGEPLGEAGHLN